MKINSLPSWSHCFSYGEEWTDKLTWAGNHACHSQINNFSAVVSSERGFLRLTCFSTTRLMGETEWKEQTEVRAFGFE
jgi:hypothetical protein